MDWSPLRRLAQDGYAPRALLDVGAHLGSFSKQFVEIFPGCAPVMIEPNPHCTDTLAGLLYESHSFAASDKNGEVELHLTREWLQSTGVSIYREATHFFRDDVLMKVRVPARRIDDVFAGRRFDVVKIDTQGAELDVLRGGKNVIGTADFAIVEVSLVDYNSGGARAEDVFVELSSMGFNCAGVLEFHRLQGIAHGGLLQMDFLFERKGRVQRSDAPIQGAAIADLLSLTDHVEAVGAAQTIDEVKGRLADIRPALSRMITSAAADSIARGDIVNALQLVLRLRNLGGAQDDLLTLVRSAFAPAIDLINANMAASEWVQAEKVATALAALLPGFQPVVRAAMTISDNLSKPTEAAVYANALVQSDPSDAGAANVLHRAGFLASAKPVHAEAARKALFPLAGTHPLLRLRDLHDLAAALLCGETRAEHEVGVEYLLAMARGLQVDVPADSEFSGWLKHYRLALTAMDLSLGQRASLCGASLAPAEIVDVAGRFISGKAFSSRVKSARPEAVFFAAADPKYIELYANHFVDSIMRNCDVPYAIVLHVIGGAKRLPEIVSALKPGNDRVFLTGDDFDPASIVTKCYDTPPKGLIPIPVAHYQSARFQRLGWLMETLNAPVFVSDIDLLLQRGVSDLLERVADRDVVFNENEHSLNAGSRLTANLVLVNPTQTARAFAGLVKNYLDEALSGPEVSRWIDQFALLMSRRILRKVRPDARIGYFDTNSDINNLMYRSFEKNPFRFLSLYHGFDMASLERAA